MKTRLLPLLIILVVTSPFAAAFEYRIGTGKTDVTGPPAGVQMWGFVREGQNTEGIHIRLWARAFVVAEPDGKERLALVVTDLGSIPHDMKVVVLDKLAARYGDTYTRANTILMATHTHAGPGGYWPASESGPLAGTFYRDHFDAIVDGIVEAIAQAHEGMQPGDIYVNQGEVENAGAQRSAAAYNNNPAAERERYGSDTDKQMTLLKFVTEDGVAGILNWFAVHPTAMTYNNKLISGDQKGRAEQLFETTAKGKDYADGFIAAFANSNCGDVTANLNLDNTGPGDDDFETTHIIAERQFQAARQLAEGAGTRLTGPLQSTAAYVDFSNLEVADNFTGAGTQRTCPSAYGWSFAAGSTEDGGGHPLFREGMTQRVPEVDAAIKAQLNPPPISEAVRDCHAPKPILFAPGDMEPPAQSQIIPLGVARIGPLILTAVPGEITTMAGRRLRESVRQAVGDAGQVIIAAYSNHYTGYITTREEYQTQNYEGGHTLFGPWTLAGMQQEYSRLARALIGGTPVDTGPEPPNYLKAAADTGLGAHSDKLAPGTWFGAVITDAAGQYAPGDTVEVTFLSANPNNNFKSGDTYIEVQRQSGDVWQTVATDDAWATRYRWEVVTDMNEASRARVRWDIPGDASPGTYRLVHRGQARSGADNLNTFEGASRGFTVE